MSEVELNPVQARMHEVSLQKDGRCYVLRYLLGQEAQALAELSDLAHDPQSDLDWRDAAVLSHQIGIALQRANRKQPM